MVPQKMENCFVDLAHKLLRGKVESDNSPCSSPEVPSRRCHLGSLEPPLVLAGQCVLPFQGVPPLQVGPIQ